MSSQGTCPSCGEAVPAGAPKGLCPGCLYRLVLHDGWEPTAPAQPAPATPATDQSLLAKPVAPEVRASPYTFGDYEILETLGHGGMGVVYKARQASLNRLVALKLIRAGVLASPKEIKRFQSEAETIAQLQHPNIVAIYEIGEHDGQHYFSMEYVPGRTLAGLAREGPLPARRAASYLKAIAEGVHYAHQRGIIHRDLTPANIIVDENDQPRITDFGLAKRLTQTTDYGLRTTDQGPEITDHGARTTDLTLSGQVLGSPNYLPPEQAEPHRGQTGPASDVYALGAILYHLLTGRPPFQAEALTTLLRQVIEADPVAPRLLNPSSPRDLETICLKCLEKEPARRYGSARALAEELGRFLADEPIMARPIGRPAKLWRWCRRNPRLALAVGAAVSSLLIGLAGIAWEWRRAEAQALTARRNAYAADMKEVQRALEDSDLGRARELLDHYRPDAKSELRSPRSEADLRGWEWRYYWSQCQGEASSTLCRYSNSTSALAFSADGRWLAVRQAGGMVALWDFVARRPLTELPADWQGNKVLAFSPQGTLLACGRRDTNGARLSVLDVSTQREIASLPLSVALRSVAFSPDAKQIASLSVDGSVRVCEIASRQIVTQFLTASLDRQRNPFKSPGPGRSSPDETTVAPGGRGGGQAGSRVWTASNLFVSHYGCVLFSPDGRWLAVGEGAPRVWLLERATGNTNVIELPQPADGITTLAFSPDGRLLAAGGGVLDPDVHVWDLVAGTELRLVGHSGWVAALAFSPDGHTLASAGADRTIRLWEVARKAEQRRFQGSADEIWALAWSPDGRSLVTGNRDGAVQCWELAAKPAAAPYSTLPALIHPYALDFLPDSKSFLTAARPEGNVLRWDAATLQMLEKLDFLGLNHSSLALSKDAHWLLLGNAAGQVQVWDLPARRLVTNLVFSGAAVAALKFSPRLHLLLAGGVSSEGRLVMKLWKVAGWEEIDLGRIDRDGFAAAAFSPDEKILAVGYEAGKAAWWNLASRKNEAGFNSQRPSRGGAQVAFSPDGRVFATAEFFGGLTLWDVASGHPKSIGRAYRDLLYRIAFSPDGRRVIASGSVPQGVLRLWDVETGRDVAALPGAPGTFNIFFSPDGNTLCAVSIEEGRALFWRAPSFAEIEATEQAKNRPATDGVGTRSLRRQSSN